MQKPNIADTQKFNRQGRIHRLLAVIQACSEAKRATDREKLIANYCFEWGASRRTIMEYLKILEGLDKIESKDNDIWIKGKSA